MSTINIFERAARDDLMFTIRGMSSVSDVWAIARSSDKGLKEVDAMYSQLDAELATQNGASRLRPKPTNSSDKLRLEILAHIIDYEVDRKEKAAASKLEAQKRQRILEELDRRANDFSGLSDEELAALI